MKESLQNIFLLLISIALCLLLGESLIKGFYHFSPNYDFEMWRYASELKQPLPLPGLPFHHFPDRSGRYYGVEISTNSLGLRDNEYSVAKPADRKRIIILGDSHTLGWGVPFNSTFPKQLEHMLNRPKNEFDVINMGIGNYNTAMEVELLKLKGLKLQPDMVVLMYFANDTEPTPEVSALTYNILRRSYLLGAMAERVKQAVMTKKDDDGLLWYYKKIYSGNSAGMQVNGKALKELFHLCRDSNIKLLIVNIPDLRRLKEYPFTFATDYIRTFAEDSNIPFLDLLPVFAPYEEKSLWVSPDDPHMNSRAHSVAAGAIYQQMTNKGWTDFDAR